jgi:VanZ family protein
MKATYPKRYPLSNVVATAIVILSLIPIPEVPQLENISLLDKWVHMVMYGGLCVIIWWEYLHQHRSIHWRRALVGAGLLPVALGGGLELAQKYLTTCRSGEWLDFMANSVGVVLAALVAVILARVCRD